MYIDATVTLPNDLALTGNLFSTQYFEVDGNTLSVSGDVSVTGVAGRVAMIDVGDVLDVEGDVLYDGATV
jgi:hypothetical protein